MLSWEYTNKERKTMSAYDEPLPDHFYVIERLYVIEEDDGSEFYGVTPDGIGFYFYNTLSEVYDQHDEDLPEIYMTAEEFEEMRSPTDAVTNLDDDGLNW